MMPPAHIGVGLIRLGDSDFVPANLEDDLRGKDVYDVEGQRIGRVGDLYIDRTKRKVCFLEVGTGGCFGIGEKRFLVPVQDVVQVAEDRVTIDRGRTQNGDGSAHFDTRVVPPRADDQHVDYASPLYSNDEATADQRRDVQSSLRHGLWPY